MKGFSGIHWIWHPQQTIDFALLGDLPLSIKRVFIKNVVSMNIQLRWFLSIALRFPTAHDFRVLSARKWARARTQRRKYPSRERNKCYFSFKRAWWHIILFNLKKIKQILSDRKKRYRWKRAKNRYSGMQIITAKTTTIRTLYVHVVLNGVIFRQISYNTVPHALHFLLVKFSLSIT